MAEQRNENDKKRSKNTKKEREPPFSIRLFINHHPQTI
jgi:hypothetical protein